MLQQDLWLPLGTLLGGVLAGWGITYLSLSRRSARILVESAQRLSSAEATASAEHSQRTQIETELLQTEARLAGLDRELAVERERVANTRDLLAEQRRFVESSRKELEDSFRSLAAAALKGTSEQFLALAEQRLGTARAKATADLDERRQAVEGLVAPLHETLARLERKTGELERSRIADSSRLGEQIERLVQSTSTLRDETTSLASALRGTETGGRWGELALRRVVEIAGMTAHCDFQEQVTIGDGVRPDMVVNLPENRRIAVDAKAPLTAFLEASNATDDAGRKAALAQHAKVLRGHVRRLAQRDYAEALDGDTEFVILYLPADAFLGAALQSDPDLQVDAMRSKILLATPTTLVALLRTIAIYWQQRSMADNAEAIAEAARELYERAAKFGEELAGVGKGLNTALDAYDRAVGSFDRRLMPMAAKLEEMKLAEGTRRKLKAPEPIGRRPRATKAEA